MSTPSTEPGRPGDHLELPVEEQLARAGMWEPADQPVIDDLSDDEERAFLEVIAD